MEGHFIGGVIVCRFQDLANGIVPRDDNDNIIGDPNKIDRREFNMAIQRLQQFESKMEKSTAASLKKKRKKRKLKRKLLEAGNGTFKLREAYL